MTRPPRTALGPRNWLSLAQVAELLDVQHPSRHYRCQAVRRLLRRLEQRDDAAYLRRVGTGPRARLWVSPAAIAQLRGLNPATIARGLDELRGDMTDLRRRLNAHGARIRRLETS